MLVPLVRYTCLTEKEVEEEYEEEEIEFYAFIITVYFACFDSLIVYKTFVRHVICLKRLIKAAFTSVLNHYVH